MAASAGHAVAYTIGPIFKYITDFCVAVFYQWLHEYCPFKRQLSPVQRCQIAASRWPNDISSEANNTYIHTKLVIRTLRSGLLTQFLTPLMLCVLILYISGGNYSLLSTPNDRFFEKLFIAILFTLRVFARNLPKKKSSKKYFSYFVLMSISIRRKNKTNYLSNQT